ncbi:MAG: NAD-dependent epimerase/dehydratase family protein [Bacteroidota bacterium]
MNKKILVTGGSGFIGTNLIEYLEKMNINFVNFDKVKPLKSTHIKYWIKGNLLDILSIRKAFLHYKPSIIIHLAARTDCDSNKITDYIDNTDGTRNLIKCIKEFECIKRVIITSTQYVYKSKIRPFQLEDNDYAPYTTYGKSKTITEEITRSANLNCSWVIVRPTNVWGPWHMRYPNELWKILDKGLYVHPSKSEVIRTYAYVKNVVHQLVAIVNAPNSQINGKTYYLGDLPIDSYIWLNEISKQLKGKSLVKIPGSFFVLPVLIGDLLKKMKIPFPIYSSRYKNMVEDYYAPTNITIKEFGLSHPKIDINIKETIEWIKEEGKIFFPYWMKK